LRFRPEFIHSMVLDDKDIVGGFYPKKGLPIDFASSPAPGGEWKIQISAVSSQAAAESEWKRIQSRHTVLLGALSFNVQSVTLPNGTFYRIQAGPLVNRDAASALCARLKAQKQDCLVVAP
ncbi:MAG: SPOR domain-containing protein, partial [Alphaproteobacteria bacterium]